MFSRHMSSHRFRTTLLVALASIVIALLALPAVALADDYSIDRVDIDATIQTDGTLSVQESREFDFDGDFHGVYWKIPVGEHDGRYIDAQIQSVGEMQGSTFIPFTEDYSGDNHTYQLSDYGSYVQVKLYSAHSYESATFQITFDYTNLAVRHSDVSELYWKFVSDGWDVESENVTCTVHLPVPDGKKVEPEENVRAWGHGPLDASVHFDGNDVRYSVPGVGSSEFAEARITFPTDWLSEATSDGQRALQDILGEERQWADEANARRERARALTYGGGAGCLVGGLACIAGSIIAWLRYRRSHKAQFDDKYFRDVPSQDHPAVLGALYRGGEPGDEDFTATLMRLTDLGAMKLELVTIESKGLLGRRKTREDYRLTVPPQTADMKLSNIDRGALLTLFDQIGRYAPRHEGDDPKLDQICFGDIEKIAKKHPERFHDAYEGWQAKVQAEVAKRRFLQSDGVTGRGLAIGCAIGSFVLFMASVLLVIITGAWALFSLIPLQAVGFVIAVLVAIKCKPMSREAIELKAQLVALRNWLKDFTRLEEAVPRDVVLWNRLLVMAVVLGVADEVIKQLKVAVPEVLSDPMMRSTYGWYYVGHGGSPYRMFNSTYSSAHSVSAAQLASSESSSGGGGGGGFSGGGGGGFGGGGGGGAF